tara:strand:+ start:538 stop:765 length:228 start_codon:yes stop_codon:yes gene_type:complete
MYEGITSGKIVKLNKILDPGNEYLTVSIEIVNPRIRLVKTTAINKNTVFINKVVTSQELKKLDIFLDRFANLQNK